MNNTKIILNENYDFDIDGFSRNTSVQDGKLVSTAYVALKDPTAADIEELRGLALYTITSMKLTVGGEDVYDMFDLEAKITSIDESLSEDGKIRTNFYVRI